MQPNIHILVKLTKHDKILVLCGTIKFDKKWLYVVNSKLDKEEQH